MKCLKNAKTGNIIRTDDKQAYNMVGKEWSYVSKIEWKTATRTPKPVEEVKEEPTVSEKQLKRKKK